MIPIFGINVTNDKNNEKTNGEEFISASIEMEEISALEEKQDDLQETVDSAKLPFYLRAIAYVSGLAALICVGAIFSASVEIGFGVLMRNAPYLLPIAIIGCAVWGVITYLGKKKEKAVMEAGDTEGQLSELQQETERLYVEIGVPDNTPDTDVLLFRYKETEKGIKPYEAFQLTPYLNLNVRIYNDGSYFHVCEINNRYSFELSELKAIRTVKKRISVYPWTKDGEPNKGEYKQYGMTTDNLGNVRIKTYHILEIEHLGKQYGIYFPCYELPAFERATGLRAEAVE